MQECCGVCCTQIPSCSSLPLSLQSALSVSQPSPLGDTFSALGSNHTLTSPVTGTLSKPDERSQRNSLQKFF